MRSLVALFKQKYPEGGVFRICNLFNLKNPDSGTALETFPKVEENKQWWKCPRPSETGRAAPPLYCQNPGGYALCNRQTRRHHFCRGKSRAGCKRAGGELSPLLHIQIRQQDDLGMSRSLSVPYRFTMFKPLVSGRSLRIISPITAL